jgi:AraC-like DNA-binding protein
MARPLSAQEDTNRRMLRARDEMDRRYAEPLDIPALAAIAHLSASQFGRVFKAVYGETPHRYLQRRRVERAMTLLRQTDRPVTDIAWDVGFASLGTFSRTFSTVVGCSPSEFRVRHAAVAVPSCFIAAWTRPREHPAAAPADPSGTAVSEKREGTDDD